jgi:hypothetical protein
VDPKAASRGGLLSQRREITARNLTSLVSDADGRDTIDRNVRGGREEGPQLQMRNGRVCRGVRRFTLVNVRTFWDRAKIEGVRGRTESLGESSQMDRVKFKGVRGCTGSF